MTQEMYAIHDNKASFFMTPWPCRNVGIARREFASSVRTKTRRWANSPLIILCIMSVSMTIIPLSSNPSRRLSVLLTALRSCKWMVQNEYAS